MKESYKIKERKNQYVILGPWGLLEDSDGIIFFRSKEDAKKEIEIIS